MRKLNSHDIFVASRLLGKIGYKRILQDILKELPKKDSNTNLTKEQIEAKQEEVGTIVISTIMDAISTNEQFEDAFFEFISSPLEMSVDDLKATHPTELVNLIIDFANQEDKETWKAFWSSLAKLMH